MNTLQHGGSLAQGVPQGARLPRRDPPEHRSRGQPLQIRDPLQPRAERFTPGDLREQRRHRVVPLAKRLQVTQRPTQPAPQHARPGTGEGQVQHVDQGPAGLMLEVAEDLQVAQRRLVKHHAPIVLLYLDGNDMVDTGSAARRA